MFVFLFREDGGKGQVAQKQAAQKDDLSLLAKEAYGKNNSNFLIGPVDNKHPYRFEVCDKTESEKFQNPTKLINIYGETLLDYTAVKDHPKYAEALTSLGITEDAVFGDSHFFLGKKEIPTLQAYALAQNYVFLSNQCPTSSAAEIKEAAQTFYNKGFVITGGPIRFGDFDTKNSPVNITFVNILDLNEKGQLSIDKMMIYGFSPNKDAIYSDMYEKYDDVASNYTGSLDLRVNTVEFLFSGLSYVEHDNWDERLYGSYVWLEEKTSFPEFLKSRKEGLENKCKSEHTKQINGGNVADNLEELENIYRGRYDSLVDLVDRKAAAGRDDRVGGIAAALGEARAIYPNIKWERISKNLRNF